MISNLGETNGVVQIKSPQVGDTRFVLSFISQGKYGNQATLFEVGCERQLK
jgi:hypothetical protein